MPRGVALVVRTAHNSQTTMAVEATLRLAIREEGIAARRHCDVVAESLRVDICMIAEGVIALDAKVETIRDSG
jgi:hypothetical protein